MLALGICCRNDSREEDNLVLCLSSCKGPVQEQRREDEEQQEHGPGLAERGLLGPWAEWGYMKTIRVTNSCLRTLPGLLGD